MAIPIPTVDDFQESTVMTIIREILDYICGDRGLVDAINDNDIASFNSSYTNNVLKIDAVKGDGSIIPVCNVTIEGGSSTASPYPTGVTITLVGTTLNFNMVMSSGAPITATADLSALAGGGGLESVVLAKSGNNITLSVNGAVQNTINPINSVSGNVANGNLTIGVNGVNSSPIAIPSGFTLIEKDIIGYSKTGDFKIIQDSPIGSIMTIGQYDGTEPIDAMTPSRITFIGMKMVSDSNREVWYGAGRFRTSSVSKPSFDDYAFYMAKSIVNKNPPSNNPQYQISGVRVIVRADDTENPSFESSSSIDNPSTSSSMKIKIWRPS